MVNVTRTAVEIAADAMRMAQIVGTQENPDSDDMTTVLRLLMDLLNSWAIDTTMNYRPDLWEAPLLGADIPESKNKIVTQIGRDRTPVQIQQLTSIDRDTEIVLPAEYMRALVMALAVELSPAFEQVANPSLALAASSAIRLIRTKNTIHPVVDFSTEVGLGPVPFLDINTRS